MKIQKILSFLFILASLLPVYYVNRWLLKVVQPKRTFLRFLLYMLIGFGLAFLYTFLVTFVTFKIFPLKK